jgi:hypothetical protein
MYFDDSYVIRIFRRVKRKGETGRAHDRVALTGTVEHASSGETMAFHDIEELWAVLAQSEKKSGRSRRKRM